jgi:hypothetical protein
LDLPPSIHGPGVALNRGTTIRPTTRRNAALASGRTSCLSTAASGAMYRASRRARCGSPCRRNPHLDDLLQEPAARRRKSPVCRTIGWLVAAARVVWPRSRRQPETGRPPWPNIICSTSDIIRQVKAWARRRITPGREAVHHGRCECARACAARQGRDHGRRSRQRSRRAHRRTSVRGRVCPR